VLNATPGEVSIDALTAAGETNLDGKVLVDVSNPIDHQSGFPPALTVCNTDSMGEQIQRAFPKAWTKAGSVLFNIGLVQEPA
jgi:predicted dinucleotide-binding enzyme